MWRSLLALGSFLLCVAAPSRAFADDVFTITNGTDTVSFTLPASPSSPQTSCGRDPGFCIDALPITIDGNPAASTVTFYSNYNNSGLSMTGSYGGSTTGYLVYGFDTNGDPLFSGYPSAPTFNPGVYVIDSFDGDLPPAFSGDLTLTISAQTPSATPEPSSLVLLGGAIAGLGGALWRRRHGSRVDSI